MWLQKCTMYHFFFVTKLNKFFKKVAEICVAEKRQKKITLIKYYINTPLIVINLWKYLYSIFIKKALHINSISSLANRNLMVWFYFFFQNQYFLYIYALLTLSHHSFFSVYRKFFVILCSFYKNFLSKTITLSYFLPGASINF